MNEDRTLLQRFGAWLMGASSASSARGDRAAHVMSSRRITRERGENFFASLRILESPTDPVDAWRSQALDTKALDKMRPNELFDLLVDVSPDTSRALWDWMRFLNPGYEIKATRNGKPSAAAQKVLDDMIESLEDRLGPFDLIVNRLHMNAWLRGAFFAEIVFDKTGTKVLDIATPDPFSVRFLKEHDVERGVVWRLGQLSGGKFIDLSDAITVRYVPIDPAPGKPYGRPLASPVLTSSLFALSLLNDLRRVVSQQGYPRVDISLDVEQLLALAPDELSDYNERKAWIDATLAEIADVYNTIEPDDAYVHTSPITVNRPVGVITADALGALDALTHYIDRVAVRALKTQPLMMAVDDSTSEANANRQWEIMVAGVKALQHLSENTLSHLLSLGLQAAGVVGEVEVRFAELRASEMLRDAMTEQLKIANAENKLRLGWITQEQASIEVTGEPPALPAPLSLSSQTQDTVDNALPVDGEERFARRVVNTWRAVRIIGDADFDGIPDDIDFDDDLLDDMSDAWDDYNHRFAGLLKAKRASDDNESSFLEKARDGAIVGVGGALVWHFLTRARAYYEEKSNRIVFVSDVPAFVDLPSSVIAAQDGAMLSARDAFVNAIKAVSDDFVRSVYNERMTVGEFERNMQFLIRKSFGAEYAAARGGFDMMSAGDWATVGDSVLDQYRYLRGFGYDILDERLSEGQARARARMYMEASTSAFEQGKQVAFGIPADALPYHPGDGSTLCGTNCKCSWDIVEREDGWHCTWTLEPGAEHCETCIVRASTYAPLVIAYPDDATTRMIREKTIDFQRMVQEMLDNAFGTRTHNDEASAS